MKYLYSSFIRKVFIKLFKEILCHKFKKKIKIWQIKTKQSLQRPSDSVSNIEPAGVGVNILEIFQLILDVVLGKVQRI